jgi:hypothetical protein
MSETDNFSHRAGYAEDPLVVAIRYARKGGTLAAGEGALLVQEIERLEARADRAEAVLARLREPSDAVKDAALGEAWSSYEIDAVVLAAVKAAEAEVSAPQPSPAEPTATDVLFPGVRPVLAERGLAMLKESMTLTQAVELYGSTAEPEAGP